MRTPDGRPVVHPMDYKLGLAPGQWEREQRLAKWERENGLAPNTPKRRKVSIRRMVAAAEKTGKTVTSVTMPDGTVLHFGGPAEVNDNALDNWLRKTNAHPAQGH
jgi:hypothetical protein